MRLQRDQHLNRIAFVVLRQSVFGRVMFAAALFAAAQVVPIGLTAQVASAAQSTTSPRVVSVSAVTAQPGDVVRLRIWREPDMSGDYTVDASGTATFPRLGAMHVVRMSPDSLQKLLVRQYTRYLKNPSIEVILLHRVRVVGAVRSPGVFTVDQTMRIRDVLALAGGASPDGRTDRARLDRNGERFTIDLNASPTASETALRSGDQISVEQKNWFARNTAIVASLLSVSAGFLFAVVAR